MKRFLAIAAAILAAGAFPSTVAAQKISPRCVLYASYPTDSIKICSVLIASRRYSGATLGKIHWYRGMAYFHTAVRKYRLALQDFDAAVALGNTNARVMRIRTFLQLAVNDMRALDKQDPKKKGPNKTIEYYEKGPYPIRPARK